MKEDQTKSGSCPQDLSRTPYPYSATATAWSGAFRIGNGARMETVAVVAIVNALAATAAVECHA